MARILVAYGTRTGSTEGVAREIGKVLAAGGATVDVRPARQVDDVSGYDAAVLGSAVRAGRLMPEVRRLARRHRKALARVPVACFVVCLTIKDDTEANRRKAAAYLAPLRKVVSPVAEGAFAGAVDPGRMGLLARLVMRLVKAAPGDFRNWEAIRAWAHDLRPVLARPAAAMPPP